MSAFRWREPRYRGVVQAGSRRMKWYEMSADGNAIATAVRAAAEEQVRSAPTTDGELEVGFVVLHHGAEAVWLLCDAWRDDILHHVLWRAELSRPTEFSVIPGGGPTACVHELAVVAHEADAFVRHVLAPASPDLDGYAADVHGDLESRRRAVLVTFDDAWRRGDLETLMGLMSDDPRYAASTGDGPGEVHEGSAAVRRAFADVIGREAAASAGTEAPPPLRPDDVWLDGDRALTRWQYAAHDDAGRPATVHGVDLWEFEGSRLASKDAYRKAWPSP